ncbi:MAG: hypothetical protein IJB70_11970 [Clostridia bacterium]|nr:hypothetical protein [Clostridia bacterium]
MIIRGTSSPRCSLCEYAFFDTEKEKYVCKINDEVKEKDDSCKKFSYDIFKYKPKKKNLFGKFSKEDFEI